jgi:hypothetical protein
MMMDFSLLAVQPAGEERERQLESGGVEHGRSLYHCPANRGPSFVDPGMGHYTVKDVKNGFHTALEIAEIKDFT